MFDELSLNLRKSYVSIIEEKEKEQQEKRVVLKEGWSLIKKDKESSIKINSNYELIYDRDSIFLIPEDSE